MVLDREKHLMNVTINPTLTATLAADRRRALMIEADIRRTRRLARRARRASPFVSSLSTGFSPVILAPVPALSPAMSVAILPACA
ncbi:MAG: hypothetical protein JWM34_2218 [Ilumatobacteraceae bacterium]|nr:hypothetical protein [Ilumatobacteraceae bacterium]